MGVGNERGVVAAHERAVQGRPDAGVGLRSCDEHVTDPQPGQHVLSEPLLGDDLGHALAAGGLRLTNGYANSPVCSPTRFALMTARYQYRLRGAAEEPINSKSRGSTTLGLPPEHPTLPSLLKAAGYRTALAGKWHLGYPPVFGPLSPSPSRL